MTLLDIVLVAVAAATAGLVWANLKARETANAAIRSVCAREGLLFLDDTVALSSMWPVRDARGRLVLRRVFAFDYSDTGHNRRRGTVTLVGDGVQQVDVALAVPTGETRH